MRTNRMLALCVVFAAPYLAAGCSPPKDAEATSTEASRVPLVVPVPPADKLLEYANELGDAELRKMAAAEMIYRDTVYEHVLDADLRVTIVYGKLYRQFRDFEVVDIQRTDSLLHPVRFTIRYDFDVIGNPMAKKYSQHDLKAAREAISNLYYVKHTESSITRTYESDEGGRPINSYSPNLERPNYWAFQTQEEFFGHSWRLKDLSQLGLE